MAGAVFRVGDHVYLRTDRTISGVIERCRWSEGEPFYTVVWPHDRRSRHGPKELVVARSSSR
jgi:hypothetical protein